MLGFSFSAAAHPQDGPHADIRILILDDSLRMNLGMNLAFLDVAAPTERESLFDVAEVELPYLRAAVERFVREDNRVVIDGVEVAAVITDYEFMRPDRAMLPLFPKSGMRGLLRVRVVVDYPIKSPPETLAITWGAFAPDILSEELEATGEAPKQVLEAQLTAEGRVQIMRFSEQEPEAIWRATGITPGEFLAPIPGYTPESTTFALPLIPVVALGMWVLAGISGLIRSGGKGVRRVGIVGLPIVLLCAVFGRGVAAVQIPTSGLLLPTEQQCLEVFGPLHANVYRAFDYTTEDEIYDALARSVAGGLLETLYNDIYQSLVMREHSAVGHVTSVELLTTEIERIERVDDAPEFDVLAKWRVEGTVYHWGHSHARTTEYEARFSVRLGTDGWRITGQQVLAQRRIGPQPIQDGEL